MFGITEFLLLTDELCRFAGALFAAGFAVWWALGFGDGASAVTVESGVATFVNVLGLFFFFYHDNRKSEINMKSNNYQNKQE